ncbi:putative Transposable element Tc1 transposase-like 17, partial [Homarus americanus]
RTIKESWMQQQSPLTNAVTIRERLQCDTSARTVRRRLHEVRIHHRTPAIKEKFEDRHRTARLQFAQLFEGEHISFRDKVSFSDEKTLHPPPMFLSTVGGPTTRGMNDNSSTYTARTVRRWFHEQPNIQLKEWPSKGCDLNSTENVWGTIVRSWVTNDD